MNSLISDIQNRRKRKSNASKRDKILRLCWNLESRTQDREEEKLKGKKSRSGWRVTEAGCQWVPDLLVMRGAIYEIRINKTECIISKLQ